MPVLWSEMPRPTSLHACPTHILTSPPACTAHRLFVRLFVRTDSSGEFDGQDSGHDFYGTLWMPPTGAVNNCDGGRAKTYCDYRQQ